MRSSTSLMAVVGRLLRAFRETPRGLGRKRFMNPLEVASPVTRIEGGLPPPYELNWRQINHANATLVKPSRLMTTT
jgi:hypothetical protein